jgi:hypothetical protein
MKKAFVSISFILIANVIFAQKLDFSTILKNVVNEVVDRQLTYQTILNQEFVVNSSANAAAAGGHDKVYFKLNIPKDAYKWIYRITILDKNSTFKFQENETLAWQLINKRNVENLNIQNVPINVFFMDNSGEALSFASNRQFKSFQQYNILNTYSFSAQSNLNGDNLYMGIQNTSLIVGAKVLVEVVALTPKLAMQQYTTYQADKQVRDAQELFDLGVINKKSYDSIASLYAPKINRAEALQRLKEAKSRLDKGEITQKDYDLIKQSLSPIILSKTDNN